MSCLLQAAPCTGDDGRHGCLASTHCYSPWLRAETRRRQTMQSQKRKPRVAIFRNKSTQSLHLVIVCGPRYSATILLSHVRATARLLAGYPCQGHYYQRHQHGTSSAHVHIKAQPSTPPSLGTASEVVHGNVEAHHRRKFGGAQESRNLECKNI